MQKLAIPLLLSLATTFCYACQKLETPEAEPELEQCDCSLEFAPVCAQDGRVYLNACFPACISVPIIHEGDCPPAFFVLDDTLSWPIRRICFPIQTQQSPRFVRLLGDGSAVYQGPEGAYFRGTQNFCR